MTTRVRNAMADFEDETLDLSLGERVSRLRSALMYNAYEAFKRVVENKKVSEQKDEEHIQLMKYFKDIEKMYMSELRVGKMLGKSEDQMNKDFLKRIKEEKSSMGEIVRDIRPISQTA